LGSASTAPARRRRLRLQQPRNRPLDRSLNPIPMGRLWIRSQPSS
jgi:hypothetical protein